MKILIIKLLLLSLLITGCATLVTPGTQLPTQPAATATAVLTLPTSIVPTQLPTDMPLPTPFNSPLPTPLNSSLPTPFDSPLPTPGLSPIATPSK